MKQIINQLKSIREIGRWLLIMRMLLWWGMFIIFIVLLLGTLDYWLVLPTWIRLCILLCIIAIYALGISSRFRHLLRFQPRLEDIALHAENHIVSLKGKLASAVGLWLRDKKDSNRITKQLCFNLSKEVISKMHGKSLIGLVNLAEVRKSLWGMFFAIATLSLVFILTPRWLGTATSRWLLPFGKAKWPQKVYIQDLTKQKIYAIGSPLHFTAGIEKGFSDQMRVRMHYRIEDTHGKSLSSWETVLMNQQGFLRATLEHQQVKIEWGFVEPINNNSFQKKLNSSEVMLPKFEKTVQIDLENIDFSTDDNINSELAINYWFESADDRTENSIIALTEKPAVNSISLKITPPKYATDLLKDQEVVLHDQLYQSSIDDLKTILQFSQLEVTVKANKKLNEQSQQNIYPGFGSNNDLIFTRVHNKSNSLDMLKWVITQDVVSTINLQDEMGIFNRDDYVLDFKTHHDENPEIQISAPKTDLAVLSQAVIPIEIIAQDDVGLKSLSVKVNAPIKNSGGESVRQDDLLAHENLQVNSSSLKTELNLENYNLQVGDYIQVYGIAIDVFEVNGKTHPETRSLTRTLRIVDQVTLTNLLRKDISLIRQHAIRAERQQRQQLDQPLDENKQKSITKRINRMQKMLDETNTKIKQNKLEDSVLKELLNNAEQLLSNAQGSSEQIKAIHQNNDNKKHMTNVVDKLGQLIHVLSQGKSVSDLQMRLKQIEAIQRSLQNDTRQLLPKTIGRTEGELDPNTKKEMKEIANRQQELSNQTENMLEQMQKTIEQMKQSEKESDHTAGEAMKQAADIAQKQGLNEKMKDAAQHIDNNKLSQAGSKQSDAVSVMSQMMGALNDRKKIKAQMLARKLKELVDQLEQLVKDQESELKILHQANDIQNLEHDMVLLRRRTMAAGNLVSKSKNIDKNPPLKSVFQILKNAGQKQGEAIFSLRSSNKDIAVIAEERSLSLLEEAVRLAKEAIERGQLQQLIEEREELINQYRELAENQRDIQDETKLIQDQKIQGRKARSKYISLAKSQNEIRQAANKLSEKVKNNTVFIYEHNRIDQDSQNIQSMLRKGRAQDNDNNVVDVQEDIADSLVMMADVLEMQNEESKFALSQGGSNAGGSGSAGSQQPKMIPPVAELRLLRAMQIGLNLQTKKMNESNSKNTKQAELLSQRQSDLADLSKAMLKKMQQNSNQKMTAPIEQKTDKPNIDEKVTGDIRS
ncbi:hypothetical protein JD969_09890 [Planctomycetota bacterium]|nr:hypothetical protein JD969_09890 [Planctomycetota bacterium]